MVVVAGTLVGVVAPEMGAGTVVLVLRLNGGVIVGGILVIIGLGIVGAGVIIGLGKVGAPAAGGNAAAVSALCLRLSASC